MVRFVLLHKTDREIIYQYLPEGDENMEAGVIAIDLKEERIFVS